MNVQFDEMIASITPEAYQNLLRAIETGRWPDGRLVTESQREHCMTAVIAWGEKNLPEEERVGYLPGKCASGNGAKKDSEPVSAKNAVNYFNG
ncbi:Conserved hypothetical protein [gamma proteobacterium HdN1]|nr:Conserved hypothetical protein [gamma proteobacterium HdN1]